MTWEIWTKGFACVGQCAVVMTVACLLDRRLAMRVAAWWAAYSEAHRLFVETLRHTRRARLQELESQE